jgi:hypothetical protein
MNVCMAPATILCNTLLDAQKLQNVTNDTVGSATKTCAINCTCSKHARTLLLMSTSSRLNTYLQEHSASLCLHCAMTTNGDASMVTYLLSNLCACTCPSRGCTASFVLWVLSIAAYVSEAPIEVVKPICICMASNTLTQPI